jgi:hypothetical protein
MWIVAVLKESAIDPKKSHKSLIHRFAPSLSRMGFDRVYPVYYEISSELETENERDL